jgi:hypothetical protein
MSTLGFVVGVGVTVVVGVGATISSNDKNSNMVKKFC